MAAESRESAVRNPLQGLIGALELLGEAADDVERRTWLDVARQCADELAAALEVAPTAAVGRSLDVLVVDDVETNRVLLATILGKARHRVATAADGRAGVEAARDGDYDVIIMDLVMPELDGLAAARAIRALPGTRGRVPIIGLSGNADPADRARSREAGIDEHLGKPVDRDVLLGCVARLVAREPLQVIDVRTLAQLRADLGEEHFLPLLADYRHEIARRLEAVGALDALADPARMMRDAHDLKSSAATVGAVALTEAAARLEDASRRRDADLSARRDAVMATRRATLDALDAALHAPESGG